MEIIVQNSLSYPLFLWKGRADSCHIGRPEITRVSSNIRYSRFSGFPPGWDQATSET